jgi:23S rRNA (uridine2552-2'-O)-methyltransferase
VWDVDQARQIDLADQALQLALKLLRPRGNFFVKVFEGDMLNDFIATVKQHFEVVKFIKPKASRAKSSEMFLLALQMKPEPKRSKLDETEAPCPDEDVVE